MFSIQESLKYGWEKFKTNKSVWAATLAILILTYLAGAPGRHSGFSLIPLLAFIALLIARIGYTKLFLKIVDGEPIEWPKALEITFNPHKVFWKFLITSIIFGLLTGIGLVLLIIPGLIVISFYLFAQILVVDLGLGPIAAMKESSLITKGSRMKLLGFVIVIAIINMAGAILLGLGLFISIPVSMFAMINVYRKLSSAKAGLIIS